jgi:hypothetical protein
MMPKHEGIISGYLYTKKGASVDVMNDPFNLIKFHGINNVKCLKCLQKVFKMTARGLDTQPGTF